MAAAGLATVPAIVCGQADAIIGSITVSTTKRRKAGRQDPHEVPQPNCRCKCARRVSGAPSRPNKAARMRASLTSWQVQTCGERCGSAPGGFAPARSRPRP